MKLIRVNAGLTIAVDREWVKTIHPVTSGGELAQLYDEVLVNGKNNASEEGEGDALLLEGEYKGHWVWVYRNEYNDLSPLELLAREAE